ncbi:hypothetical protein Tco_1157782, partial [Tanacetum coccineum]
KEFVKAGSENDFKMDIYTEHNGYNVMEMIRYNGYNVWSAAACTIKEHFLQIMEQIKMLDEAAHKWLVERDPNSWSRAFFEMDRDTAAFENGISESFNSRILNARGKPLITMLEDIRIYLMQRVYYMNKQAMMLEDTITPSIRRQLENLKIAQSLNLLSRTRKLGHSTMELRSLIS